MSASTAATITSPAAIPSVSREGRRTRRWASRVTDFSDTDRSERSVDSSETDRIQRSTDSGADRPARTMDSGDTDRAARSRAWSRAWSLGCRALSSAGTERKKDRSERSRVAEDRVGRVKVSLWSGAGWARGDHPGDCRPAMTRLATAGCADVIRVKAPCCQRATITHRGAVGCRTRRHAPLMPGSPDQTMIWVT